VWLVATTYQHADGSASVTTLTTVEGSSRDTAVHSILGVHSADVPYDDADAKLRAHSVPVLGSQGGGMSLSRLIQHCLKMHRTPPKRAALSICA
jgi:hypothetical protein